MALVKNPQNIGFFPVYIKQRITRNKNFIACITGQTGSGKSWSALRLGEILDPEFNDENICFSSTQFMNLVTGRTKQLKRGSVILFDEIQVSMSHVDFQSVQAKMINFVLQTFRHKNFILLVTSPFFSFINASARKLFHSRMETISIDKNKKQVTLKPFLLQTNQDTGQVYRKYLRVQTRDGIIPLKSIKVAMPSDQLIEAYERKKTEFTNNLNKSIQQDLQRLEGGKASKPLTPTQAGVVEDLIQGLTVPQISEKREMSIQVVYFHMNQAEKKGVNIIPVREHTKVLRYEVSGYGV